MVLYCAERQVVALYGMRSGCLVFVDGQVERRRLALGVWFGFGGLCFFPLFLGFGFGFGTAEFGVDRVEHGVLGLPPRNVFFIWRQNPYRNWLAPFDSDTVGGAVAHVEYPMFRATVVDAYNYLQSSVLVGNHDVGAQRDFPVGRGEEVLVEYLPIGSFAPLEFVVVVGAFVGVLGNGVVYRVVLPAKR